MNKVLISIVVITYGHEKYILKALDGILSQETQFTYEVILANDCSPDNSHEVISNYLAAHPKGKLVKYFRHTKNIGMSSNFLFAINKCEGKYIAMCEGDDCWNDMSKLETQTSFLEKHSSIALVHTDYDVYYQESGVTKQNVNYNLQRTELTGSVFSELIRDNFISTLTTMIRSNILKENLQELFSFSKNWLMIDYPLWLLISANHNIGYINKSMATYRYLSNSASHSSDFEKNLKFLLSELEIRLFFLDKYLSDNSKLRNIVLTKHFNDRLHIMLTNKGFWGVFLKDFIKLQRYNRNFKITLSSFKSLFKKSIYEFISLN